MRWNEGWGVPIKLDWIYYFALGTEVNLGPHCHVSFLDWLVVFLAYQQSPNSNSAHVGYVCLIGIVCFQIFHSGKMSEKIPSQLRFKSWEDKIIRLFSSSNHCFNFKDAFNALSKNRSSFIISSQIANYSRNSAPCLIWTELSFSEFISYLSSSFQFFLLDVRRWQIIQTSER